MDIQQSDRLPNGYFAPGNKIAKGNPFARRIAELRKAIYDSITPEQMADTARAMVSCAIDGDVAACKLLWSYAMGKPPERIEITGEDGQPIRVSSDQAMSKLRQLLESANR